MQVPKMQVLTLHFVTQVDVEGQVKEGPTWHQRADDLEASQQLQNHHS
jgi:hypothetical protein